MARSEPASGIDVAACAREIQELHDFFQGWLEGSLPPTDAVFARFTAATASDFLLIGPDGSTAGRDATAAWIRAAHGTRRGFRLWTDEHVLRASGPNWALATYREWQTRDGATTARLSTVLFTADGAAPAGLLWRHVHETWLTA
jgi:hypothetical protein